MIIWGILTYSRIRLGGLDLLGLLRLWGAVFLGISIRTTCLLDIVRAYGYTGWDTQTKKTRQNKERAGEGRHREWEKKVEDYDDGEEEEKKKKGIMVEERRTHQLKPAKATTASFILACLTVI